MTSGLSPIEEHNRLRRRAEWIPKREFIRTVEAKLQELGVFNQVVDSVKLAMSLDRVRVRAKDLGPSDAGGQCVKHVEPNGRVYGVITLNMRRHPLVHQWDCAHELIHLWFHPPNAETDPCDHELMRIYEIQANWGAKEIKMPRAHFASTYARLILVEKDVAQALSDYFGVGITAVRNRIDELKRDGLLQYMIRQRAKPSRAKGIMTGNELRDFIRSKEREWSNVFEDLQASRTSQRGNDTETAMTYEIDNDKYMQMVAEKAAEWARSQEELTTVTYDDQHVLPRELFHECPRCGNDDFHENGKYCWRCGLARFNECTRGISRFDFPEDDYCGEYNRMDARFCEMCGAPTTYYKINFLRKWTVSEDDSSGSGTDEFDPDDVPF